MTIYYAIVDGDPISSGGSIHVFENDERIEGPDGRTRAVAYLGDKAWCEACQRTHRISTEDARRLTLEISGGN